MKSNGPKSRVATVGVGEVGVMEVLGRRGGLGSSTEVGGMSQRSGRGVEVAEIGVTEVLGQRGGLGSSAEVGGTPRRSGRRGVGVAEVGVTEILGRRRS